MVENSHEASCNPPPSCDNDPVTTTNLFHRHLRPLPPTSNSFEANPRLRIIHIYSSPNNSLSLPSLPPLHPPKVPRIMRAVGPGLPSPFSQLPPRFGITLHNGPRYHCEMPSRALRLLNHNLFHSEIYCSFSHNPFLFFEQVGGKNCAKISILLINITSVALPPPTPRQAKKI